MEIKALIFVNDKNIKKTKNSSGNILNYYYYNMYFVSLLKSSVQVISFHILLNHKQKGIRDKKHMKSRLKQKSTCI